MKKKLNVNTGVISVNLKESLHYGVAFIVLEALQEETREKLRTVSTKPLEE